MLWIGPTWWVFTVWAVGSTAEGRKEETVGGEEEGWRVGGSSEDSATMRNRWPCSFSYAVSEHVWVCFLKTLLLTHLDDQSCILAAMTAVLKGFPPCSRTCFSEPFLPSSIRPSIRPSFLFPCSALQRVAQRWACVGWRCCGTNRETTIFSGQYNQLTVVKSRAELLWNNILAGCVLSRPLDRGKKS